MITKLAIFLFTTLLFINPVFADVNKIKINSQTENDGFIKWTFDSPIKAPKSGCKNVKLKYKIIGGPREIVGYFAIVDNSNKTVSSVSIYTGFTVDGKRDGRSGTKKLKICAEPWSEGYDTYSGIKAGTYDVGLETTDYDNFVLGQKWVTVKVK